MTTGIIKFVEDQLLAIIEQCAVIAETAAMQKYYGGECMMPLQASDIAAAIRALKQEITPPSDKAREALIAERDEYKNHLMCQVSHTTRVERDAIIEQCANAEISYEKDYNFHPSRFDAKWNEGWAYGVKALRAAIRALKQEPKT